MTYHGDWKLLQLAAAHNTQKQCTAMRTICNIKHTEQSINNHNNCKVERSFRGLKPSLSLPMQYHTAQLLHSNQLNSYINSPHTVKDHYNQIKIHTSHINTMLSMRLDGVVNKHEN